MTAEQLMKQVLKNLVVAGDESSVPDIEAQDFILALNNLVAEIEAPTSVSMGWTEITNIGDTLTCPATTLRSLSILAAIELADSYAVPLQGTELKAKERQAKDTILRICTTRTGAYKPSTLPLGSGNEDQTFRGQRFYTGGE
jgi:hypothetical protein